MSTDEDLTKNFKKLNLKDLNILLLGETGVGKSTFVNALANYVTFKDVDTAENNNLITLIPNRFNIEDKDGKRHKVQVGASDKNENIKPGESATQDVKTYVFPIFKGTVNLRIIDTPGLVDTRGIDQDEMNCENILAYLSQLHELHAICILLKPTNTRLTVGFEYCIKKILSHLDKSAAANIIFCFTNSRGSNFASGESHTCIEQIIRSVKLNPPHAEIPFDKNIFCFDSEAYLYLAAKQKDIQLAEKIKLGAVESWNQSRKESKKMLAYIQGDKNGKGLVPHLVKATVSINEIRRIIDQLSKPLLDISENIEHNIRLLKRHQQKMSAHDQTLDELKSNLYMPVMQLKEIKLPHPVTVCASASCVEVVKVDGINTTDYKTKCHDRCYLTGITKNLVGDAGLRYCAAMAGTNNCQICSCNFMTHMHIYYMTEKVSGQIVDHNVQNNITSKEQALEVCRLHKKLMEQRVTDYKREHHKIVETTALFAHFLQNNAITPFNDSYAAYIDYLLTREKYFGPRADQETILHLTNLKSKYDEIKKTFQEALKNGNEKVATPAQIKIKINKLFKLPLMGSKISQLYNVQKTARKTEYKDTEYFHKYVPLKLPSKEQGKPKQPRTKPTNSGAKSKTNKPPPYNEAVGHGRNPRYDSPPVHHPPQPSYSLYNFPPQQQHAAPHYSANRAYTPREEERTTKFHITVPLPYYSDSGYGSHPPNPRLFPDGGPYYPPHPQDPRYWLDRRPVPPPGPNYHHYPLHVPRYAYDPNPYPPAASTFNIPLYSGFNRSTSYSNTNENTNRGGAQSNRGRTRSNTRGDSKSNQGEHRGTRGTGRGNFKRNTNRKGNPKKTSEPDSDSDSSVFSFTR